MYIGQANLIRINSLHENFNLVKIKCSPTASQTSHKTSCQSKFLSAYETALAVCFVGSLS